MGVDGLLIIALLGGASLALAALYLQQSLAWQRAPVRARLGIDRRGASAANGALLRPAPEVPPLGRILISDERRARLELELARAGWVIGVGWFLALRTGCALAGALVGVFILSRLASV